MSIFFEYIDLREAKSCSIRPIISLKSFVVSFFSSSSLFFLGSVTFKKVSFSVLLKSSFFLSMYIAIYQATRQLIDIQNITE